MKKKSHLEELETTLIDLQKNFGGMHKTEMSPQIRQVRILENRLDKVMLKFNEAQSIRKTYEAIEKRLCEERVGFDNQLATIERTLKAKERDYEELLLLSHNAYHAKEMSQAELHRFEQGVMEERNQRDKEVREKKILVQQRVDMNNRLENRERMLRKQAETQQQSDRELTALSATANLTSGVQSDIAVEEKQKLTEYDEAFDRIKEATGVADVNEVIQKFLTQEDTYNSLVALTKENGGKIEGLTEERRKLRLQVEELKFAVGGTGGRRAQIDGKEVELAAATDLFERNRARYERTRKNLINIKAGVGHLNDQLETIRLEGESGHMEMNDENVEEVLQKCELKLSRLMSMVHRLEDPSSKDHALAVDDDRYEEKLLNKSQSDVRVRLNEGDQDGDDDGDDFEDEDKDVSSRKNVKYISEQIVDKHTNKNKKKGKKKKGETA